ncbi:hypothetical protein QEH59_06710 [Coraliomargarita sp. SDUM461004]|uniref:PEP-CTERM protein-sorting domain-containing protein n=1 Tax=Thalassobacterium sedimentorum TaxID=3041258 RepID=A0ABU1AHE5_9BACT|nr:hypothetical protein [Coraliomargarita sp. SDUM461004]MDQ8194107.1 hypothetical protein [Coraliomargarita sp. SDUM461004]
MSTTNWTLGASANSGNVIVDTVVVSDVTDPDMGTALQLSAQVDFSSTNNKWFATSVFNDSYTYDPSVSGELTSFSFSGDFTANYGTALRVFLEQGGETFWLTVTPPEGVAVVANSGVTSVSYAVLDADNFTAFIGSSGSLDFSETGSEITFGYGLRYGSGAAFNNRVLEFNADNVKFGLSTIPEPAQAGVVLGAIGLLIVALRRRRS